MKSKSILKLLCMVLALTLLCGCSAQPVFLLWNAAPFAAPDAELEPEQMQGEPDNPSDASITMTKENVTTYVSNLEAENIMSLPLYFKNGNRQIPYMDLETIRELMIESNTVDPKSLPADTPAYDLTLETQGSQAVFTRENSYTMEIDFDADTIRFVDYDMFMKRPCTITINDVLVMTGYDNQGRPCLFQRVKSDSYDRYGEIFTLNLADYGIDLIYSDGNYYIPMQTMADVLFPGYFFLYNENEVFVTNEAEAVSFMYGNTSKLLERYYATPVKVRSQELIDYTYSELCFILDNFYGLKELHDIDSFDNLFTRILVGDKSMKEALCSPDPRESDAALAQLMLRDLDDNHSSYVLPGFYTGEDRTIRKKTQIGVSTRTIWSAHDTFTAARQEQYPDGVPGYEEIGNTAYITFDSFTFTGEEADYYNHFPTADTNTTIGLLIYAHSRIMREGSPIENVVLDLSCNMGGTAESAVYTCSWFLGETCIYFQNANTGAEGCTAYRCDLNLDREFDEEDTLQGKNLYCIISPASFSCGNMVPVIFAASHRVTLIGQNSGGGSCIVLSMTTASGSIFRTSGPKTVSVIKNGAYYDVDEGVAPDIPLTKTESFYDRVGLTAYLNSRR